LPDSVERTTIKIKRNARFRAPVVIDLKFEPGDYVLAMSLAYKSQIAKIGSRKLVM